MSESVDNTDSTETSEDSTPSFPGHLVRLDLAVIKANPNQPRKSFPARQLQQLTDSIRAAGLIQPIVVRPIEPGKYQIVAGERRFRAFQELARENEEYAAIPAIIQDRDDDQTQVAALIENIIRDDLNPIERGQALKDLKEQLGITWKDVAERVGLTERSVHYLTGTLKLRAEFKEAVAEGRISEKQSRLLRKLQTRFKDAAYELFEYVLDKPSAKEAHLKAVAKVLTERPGYSAEEAARFLRSKTHKDALPKVRVGPENTAFRQVIRGMKTVLGKADEIEMDTLSQEEKAKLLATAEQLRAWLDSVGV